MDPSQIREAILLVVEWCDAGWTIQTNSGALQIRQLEDGRFAVDRLSPTMKPDEEELFEDGLEAVDRFMSLAARVG